MYKFHSIGAFVPFINYKINMMSDGNWLNEEYSREIPIIVSLTSYRERFKDLPLTLYSLFNQSLKPDKIILWLDESSEELAYLPYEISRFIKFGLEIRFVKDIGPYTKAIYAFKEFSSSIIVTADDDIYYRKDWLKNLYFSYIAHSNDIHVHRAHRVLINDDKILPYESWEKCINEETARFDNFLTGVGGVLYPPNCFSGEVLREDVFIKYSPKADDIWFWIMALLHNRKIRIVKNHYRLLVINNIFSHIFAETLYNFNKLGGNDEQLKNLLRLYGQNIYGKLYEQ